MYNSLFDRFFGQDGINPWGSPFKLEKYLLERFDDEKDLEEEKFEVVKGNYKTTILCKFNKKGYMVSHSVVSEYVPSQEEEQLNLLKNEMREALKLEDYKRAAKLKPQIEKIEQQIENKGKPTL